jgi:protein gp37
MSNIEWTDRTWNPTRGCTRVSEGCRNCYAERQAIRQSGPGGGYEGLVASHEGGPRWTGKVRFVAEKLAEPLRWKKPARVFVNSMSDLFHEGLSNEEIAAVFAVMALAPQHTFQVLTKRPARVLAWFAWASSRPAHDGVGQGGTLHPFQVLADASGGLVTVGALYAQRGGGPAPWPLPNVWLGVSVENQKAADERIPLLLQTPAAVRFLSVEPMLGPVDLSRWLSPHVGEHLNRERPLDDEVREHRVEQSDDIARPVDLPASDGLPSLCLDALGVPTHRAADGGLEPRDDGGVGVVDGQPRAIGAARSPAPTEVSFAVEQAREVAERDPLAAGEPLRRKGPALSAQSGPGARPCDVAWIRGIVEQCRAAGVACFVKQLGARPRWADSYDLPDDVVTALDANGHGVHEIHRIATEGLVHVGGRKGGDMAEWPADLRVREFPAVSR